MRVDDLGDGNPHQRTVDTAVGVNEESAVGVNEEESTCEHFATPVAEPAAQIDTAASNGGAEDDDASIADAKPVQPSGREEGDDVDAKALSESADHQGEEEEQPDADTQQEQSTTKQAELMIENECMRRGSNPRLHAPMTCALTITLRMLMKYQALKAL